MKSPKWHIRKNGEPGICTAAKGQCPLGGEENHYSTAEECRTVFEEKSHLAFSVAKQASDDFENLSRKSEAFQEKLEKWQSYALEKFPDGPLSEKGRISLEKLHGEIIQINSELRAALQKSRLADLDLVEMGLRKEIVVDSRKSKWVKKNFRFYEWMKTMNLKFSHHSFSDPEIKRITVKELSAWAEISINDAESLIDSYETYSEAIKSMDQEPVSYDEYVVSLFQNRDNWEKDRVFVDLETTEFDPRIGEILEVGAIRVNRYGEIVGSFEQRFDMENSEFRDRIGTGAQFIHHIAPSDLVGLSQISSKMVQRELGELINGNGAVLVAHNAEFEHAWLSEHLDGFWSSHDPLSGDSLSRGRDGNGGIPSCKTQDTRIISALLQTTKTNKLQSFSAANGISPDEYNSTGHGALADSDMTRRALFTFRDKFSKMENGKRPAVEFEA